MNHKPLLIAIGVFLAAAVAGGLYYYYFVYNFSGALAEQRKEAEESLTEGRKLVQRGEVSNALPILEDSVNTAVDKEQESRAKLSLAGGYIITGMPEKGVALLKEISLDTTYPAGYRSTAGQQMIEHYLGNQNIDFALQNIFTGPVWGDFIKKEDGATSKMLEMGVIRALEWVAALAPAFPAEYTLASKYALLVGETSDATKRVEYANLTLEHIKKGDTAYTIAVSANNDWKTRNPGKVPPYTNYRFGLGLEHKGLSQARLYEEEFGDYTLDEVKATFEKAVALFENDPDSLGSIGSALFTRYNLAIFLININSTRYATEVKNALGPIYNPAIRSNAFFQNFLKTYGSDARYYKTKNWYNMVGIAKVDSRFRDLLISLGWKSSDLQ